MIQSGLASYGGGFPSAGFGGGFPSAGFGGGFAPAPAAGFGGKLALFFLYQKNTILP